MSFNLVYAWNLFLKSFMAARVTFQITIVAVLIGIPIALLVAAVNLKKTIILSQIAQVYISFIRGTPMMIQIYIIYYLVPRWLNQLVDTLGWKIDVYAIDAMTYAYIVFALHAGATLGEVFRAALGTVEQGQIDAASSLGFTRWQTFRRVIFPQSIVVAMPNICTQFLGILKGTSLVFSMAILDITGVAKVAANESYKFLEAYLAILAVYVIIDYIVEKLFRLLERRISRYRVA
jgi:L-cystine transport system permease protein